jgi:2-polyprenyl-6-methoxyphenol hydroxylase-like FAD-dependent oxidoreductase
MTGRRRHALIIGGSVGGLFAALYLRRSGWSVTVYERSAVRLEGRGAGIMTHPEILAALAGVGIMPGADLGVAIAWRAVLGRDGRELATRRLDQVATSWTRLYGLLAEAFGANEIRHGASLVEAERRGDRVIATFADGTTADGDLLVGADGVRSRVRQTVDPDATLAYAGYVAWRGLIDEAQFPPQLHARLFERFVFALPPAEQFLGYPVAGPGNDLRSGHRSWNIVWYRPAEFDTELPRLLTDATGHRHEGAIPPPLIAPQTLDELRRATSDLLPPPLADVMALARQPFLQPIYDLETARMAKGRLALVGDAAFVVRPHVGAGVVKAAEDAACLARCLTRSDDLDEALATYDAERRPAGRRFVAQARRLGCYLRRTFESEADRAEAARYADAAAVLRDTAVLDFLRH